MQVVDASGNVFGQGLEITDKNGKPKVVATTFERRHDFNVYDYLGIAPNGSLDSANVWTITRLTIASNGSAISQVATNVNWTGRYTHIYV